MGQEVPQLSSPRARLGRPLGRAPRSTRKAISDKPGGETIDFARLGSFLMRHHALVKADAVETPAPNCSEWAAEPGR